MQLARVFRGNMEEREGWGWHDMARWELFFETLHEIGQTKELADASTYITNEFVGPANTFDHDKVKADAEGYSLPEDMQAVDITVIEARFFDNAIR
jgi:NitT/TauT family transport system substrate-binding protein